MSSPHDVPALVTKRDAETVPGAWVPRLPDLASDAHTLVSFPSRPSGGAGQAIYLTGGQAGTPLRGPWSRQLRGPAWHVTHGGPPG